MRIIVCFLLLALTVPSFSQVRENDVPDEYIVMPHPMLVVYVGYRKPTIPTTPEMTFYRAIIDPMDLPDFGTNKRLVEYDCYTKNDIWLILSRTSSNDFHLSVILGKSPDNKDYRGSLVAGSTFKALNLSQEDFNVLHIQSSPQADDIDYQVDAKIYQNFYSDEFTTLSASGQKAVSSIPCSIVVRPY